MKENYVLKRESERRHWMVVYTKSKCEKKADQLLQLQGIQSYCPLVKTKRKWADRLKVVELPLFKSYLFVYVNYRERLKVLQTAGIVNFIYYCGKPAIVPPTDIDQIRIYTNHYEDIEAVSINTLRPGDRVTIKDGILFDFNGEVLEIHGKSVLVIVKQLDCALIAKVKVNLEHVFLTKAADSNYSVIN